ncbi:hypothetical protein LPJ63_001069 [Coemansia sp. RSA 2711]|nr:hypothetical protein LPJ63_001069 [Coemansia sp. RSA 2711]KAJ2318260.1 hypothetical protein IWW52_002664 [Coemansia sp. RSA 2704]KAJ2318804.1 hypothetical protein IWW51_005023 [Coemansia sp. RSA 2702]
METLPQDVFNQVALELDAADLGALALVSRSLGKMARCDQLWIERIAADFGDRALIVDLLAEAGVDIAEQIETSTELAPWRLAPSTQHGNDGDSIDRAFTHTGHGLRCYRERLARVFPASEDERVNRVKHFEAEIDQVKLMLRDGPQAGGDVFVEAACRLVLVQEWFPVSAECYYLWALICFMHNALKPALVFLSIGHDINREFVPIHELKAEVQSMADGVFGVSGQAPLLDASCTAPSPQLAKALAIIFQRFDRDRDGVLNASELGAVVRVTNGQPAPAAMVTQIISAFGGQIQARNGRSVMGWDISSLQGFYVAQTMQDPQETRQDLAKFGFDPHTLRNI